MKVLTQSKTSKSLDWRGLTMTAPCAATTAPAAEKLARPSVTR